jgi:MFS family permease
VIECSKDIDRRDRTILVMTANHTAAPLTAPQAATRSNIVEKTSWGPIAVLSLVLLGAGIMRAVFSPLQEAAMLDLKLSDFQISLVQGFAAGLPGAIIALPIAWVIDHGRRVRLLLALIAGCIAGTIWTSYSGDFTTLFLSRMLAAVCANSALAVAISLSADLCIADHRGRAVLTMALGAFGGIAGGFALGGTLVDVLARHPIGVFGDLAPWRETHLLVGLGGSLGLLPLLWLREPLRHEVEHAGAALRPALKGLWRKRGFLAPLFVGQIGVSLADTSATIWAAPVLIRDYHLQPGDFSIWMGGLLFVASLAGAIFGALGAERGQKTRRRGALLAGAVVAAAVGIPGALFPIMPSVAGFAALLGILLLSGGAINLIASTTVATLIPNDERGICIAAFGIVNSVFGLGIAPTLVTFGSWAMGGAQHLAMSLTVIGVVTCTISLIGYTLAMRNAPAPLDAVMAA